MAAAPLLLQLIQFVPQDVNTTLRYCEVVTLRHMNISMSHLVAQQVCGRIHFRQHRSISVPLWYIKDKPGKP